MSIEEIKEAFEVHGFTLQRGWEIVLSMLFDSNNAKEAELVGYDQSLKIHFIDKGAEQS
jgi:hypothetical protein